MSDPERLLSGSGAEHHLERAMLDSLRVVTVPAQAKGLVWAGLSASSLQAAAAGSSAGSLWRGALKTALASKAGLIAVPVVVLAALSAGALWRRPAAAPTPAQVTVSTPAALSPPANNALDPSAPLSTQAPVAPATAERPAALSPHPDRLAQESALLTRARAELRAGNASAAQGTLARMQKEFGAGALRQEREVIAIEALAAEGNAAAASRRAHAFIAAHPESPHAEPLRRFLTTP